ncbi:MAG: IclR family transcriptional regulator [Ktedonobacteraceae bacterium]|nr:IclR family transcriptional regulator [Chloroflexota bacterium]
MAEHIIRHTERAGVDNGPVAPAPMVERAFRLLELLSASEEGLTLSDLARALDMSKGSIHGLLKTLESSQVIEQSEERLYVLGPRIYDLAQGYIQRAGLRRFALPAMRRLAAASGETVFLGLVEQKSVRIIERIEDESEIGSLRISARRGTRIPLLAGATGRLVLAHVPEPGRAEFLRTCPLQRFTEHSITDPAQFLAAAEESARVGISIDHEEYLPGVNAVAAPIYGLGRTLVALLWIVGFSSHFDDAAIARAVPQLRAESETISRSLGAK